MKKVLLGTVAAVGLFALSGAAIAQEANNNNGTEGSVVVQNNGTSPNSGQQGGNNQLYNAQQGIAGDGGQILLGGDDTNTGSGNAAQGEEAVASTGDAVVSNGLLTDAANTQNDGTVAQAVDSTAVGGNASFFEGNVADGSIFEGNGGDLAVSPGGYAVEEGAIVEGGGIAFGDGVDIDDETAIVGRDGVALVSDTDEIADEGSAVIVGDQNAVGTAHDDAASVGQDGSALFVDVDDSAQSSVFGGLNRVSIGELEQEVSMDDSGAPVMSVGAWTPEAVEAPDDANSIASLSTGDIGGSISSIDGLNAVHLNTGAMNQGSVHGVAVSATNMNF